LFETPEVIDHGQYNDDVGKNAHGFHESNSEVFFVISDMAVIVMILLSKSFLIIILILCSIRFHLLENGILI